ncbi:MAG: hypothetical protein JO021_15945 [Alphaproteobacteria bacterium]|nr:hypothetical protein [Alphaproteobacteria bacterium]
MTNLNLSSLSFLANQPLPVELGTFTVGPDGTPVRHERAALNFTFDYTGAVFTATVEPNADGAKLRIDADLAPMPYTAEGRDRRRDLQIIVRASRTGMKHGRLVLDPQRHIHLACEITLQRPVTPASFVTGATQLLIEATPWIALLRRHLGPSVRGPAKPGPQSISGSAG